MSEQAVLALGELVSKLDFPVLAAIVLILGYFQTWVWGHQLKASDGRTVKMEEERNFYRSALFRTLKIAEKE